MLIVWIARDGDDICWSHTRYFDPGSIGTSDVMNAVGSNSFGAQSPRTVTTISRVTTAPPTNAGMFVSLFCSNSTPSVLLVVVLALLLFNPPFACRSTHNEK